MQIHLEITKKRILLGIFYRNSKIKLRVVQVDNLNGLLLLGTYDKMGGTNLWRRKRKR
jgi:hypothetical protein